MILSLTTQVIISINMAPGLFPFLFFIMLLYQNIASQGEASKINPSATVFCVIAKRKYSVYSFSCILMNTGNISKLTF